MKTETLLNFQYYTPATSYCVRATEYTTEYGPLKGAKHYRLTVVDGNAHTTTAPNSRAEAIYSAEAKLKGFVERLKLTYGD